MKDRELSQYLSYVLRHNPSDAGVEIEVLGFVDVNKLIDGVNKHYNKNVINLEILERIVREDNKNRYSFNDDKTKIRANQGHSIKVDLGLEPIKPPMTLFHGTAERFMDKISVEGIKKMSRDFVHLSADECTASSVGVRHGKPVVIVIDSDKMYEDGIKFYKSTNGVWLTEYVESKYFKAVCNYNGL